MRCGSIWKGWRLGEGIDVVMRVGFVLQGCGGGGGGTSDRVAARLLPLFT